eukprot:4680422-Lingulodinium_polyedra.AAC.1
MRVLSWSAAAERPAGCTTPAGQQRTMPSQCGRCRTRNGSWPCWRIARPARGRSTEPCGAICGAHSRAPVARWIAA